MSDQRAITVLGIAGSLRKASYNRAALRAAVELAPDGMHLETFDIAPIPVYNEDLREQGYPPPVQEMRDRMGAADALLFVTPEYNLLDSRRAEECHRLGVTAPGTAVRRQADRHHGREPRNARQRPGAIPSAAVLRFPQRNGSQPARGDDREREQPVRRRGEADRRRDAQDHRIAARSVARLDASPEAITAGRYRDLTTRWRRRWSP